MQHVFSVFLTLGDNSKLGLFIVVDWIIRRNENGILKIILVWFRLDIIFRYQILGVNTYEHTSH